MISQWSPNITHIVADKALTYSDIMKYLNPIMKADTLPPNIILVNEDYPIDCTQYMSLLNPDQMQYAVKGFGTAVEESAVLGRNSQEAEKSLEIKSTKARKWDDPPEKQTPPRSQSESQRNLPNEENESSRGVWLLPKETEAARLMQSPKEYAHLPDESSRGSFETADIAPLSLFSGFGDALEQAIQEAKKYQHLPLDMDDEDEELDRPPSSEGEGQEDSEDSERDRAPPKPKRRYKKKGATNQDTYSCMHGGTGKAVESNPNGITI